MSLANVCQMSEDYSTIYRKRGASYEKGWKIQWLTPVPADRSTGAKTVRSSQPRAQSHQFYSDFEKTFVLCSRKEKYVSWTTVNRHVTKEMYPNVHPLYGFSDRNVEGNLIFVVPSIMLYSSEISPTRCNNCLVLCRAACRQHDTEQGSDYQQLHNDRTVYYWHIWQKLAT